MNKFTGTLTYSDKTPAPNAKVKLTVSGSSSINESTTTDKDGNWSISLKEDVNPKDVTILFSKSGYKSKQVTNPGPTEFFEKLIDPKEGGSLELQSLFGSGKWKVESLSGEDKDVLDHELEDLFQFIKLKSQNVQIKIRSSESQVPNSDNEGGTRTDEFRNNPGSLAKARGESLKEYIELRINEKIEADADIQNKENYRPIFNYTEDDITKIGNELWERDNPQVQAENDLLKQQEGVSRSADLSKYKKDQYVAVDVTLINKEEDCAAANLYLFVMYLTSDLGGKGGHDCNSALYQLFANDELIYRDDGKEYASLNNNIIISDNLYDTGIAPKDYNNRQEKKYNEELKKYFRPEFLNRLDEIIIFRHLTRNDITQISEIMIKQLKDRMKEKEIELEIKQIVKTMLIDQGYDPIYGARPLRRAVMRLLEDNLAQECLSKPLYPRTKLIVDADLYDNITVEVDYTAVDPDLKNKDKKLNDNNSK